MPEGLFLGFDPMAIDSEFLALPAGQYTLKVYTRSGLGDQFGVTVATRKVTVA